MIPLAIRCHPCVPVPAGELERWLDQLVHDLRADVGVETVKMSRLTQGGPNTDLDAGWLIELELAEDDLVLAGERLTGVMRDMGLLGLQPSLLTPDGAWTNRRAA